MWTKTTSIDAVQWRSHDEMVNLGMALIGLAFSAGLFGVSMMQLVTYYQKFPNDRHLLRSLVAIVGLLNAASMVFITHACWFYLVTDGSLLVSVWSLNVEIIFSMIISGISESFLAYRVWKVSGRKLVLTAMIMFLALLHFATGQASAAQNLVAKQFKEWGPIQIPSIMRLGSAALCDTTIAVSLVYYLHRKRTGYAWTDKIIDRLCLYSISTGVVTSITSIVCIATYMIFPAAWVYEAFCFLISRLYAITFFSSLNSRQFLRSSSPVVDSDASTTDSIRHQRGLREFFKRHKTPTPTQIGIHVVTETITDLDYSPTLDPRKTPESNRSLSSVVESKVEETA